MTSLTRIDPEFWALGIFGCLYKRPLKTPLAITFLSATRLPHHCAPNTLPTIWTAMCSRECKGDQYRGCGHYVVAYYTGETFDCGRSDCKLSRAHMHKTAKSCFCNTTWREHRKVQNLFQWKCDPCKEADEAERSAEFDRRTRRNW